MNPPKVAVSSVFAEWNTTMPYLEVVLGFSFVMFLVETYLSYRQHKNYLITKRPPLLEPICTEETFKKAQLYGKDKSSFGFFLRTWSEAQTFVFLKLAILPFLWTWTGQVLKIQWGMGSEYEIIHSLFFFWSLTFLSTLIEIPPSLFSTFVIEERHGFNKSTFGLFVADAVKGYFVGGILGSIVIAALVEIVRRTGEVFYFYAWGFVVVFTFVMMTVYPILIQPLFNKMTPLEPGPLRTKIEALAARISFPLTKLYVMDGSKRSAHSNAYFYGFFKNKRIVLFDTLLKQTKDEELCAVLGHELGHWSLNHVTKHIIISQTQLFVLFWLFSHFINNGPFYAAFGFPGKRPVLIGLILFGYIYAPLGHLMGWIMNMLSRKHEFDADKFSHGLGYGTHLRSALTILHMENLSTMIPDPWFSSYTHSHPPLVERLSALEALEKGGKKRK